MASLREISPSLALSTSVKVVTVISFGLLAVTILELVSASIESDFSVVSLTTRLVVTSPSSAKVLETDDNLASAPGIP